MFLNDLCKTAAQSISSSAFCGMNIIGDELAITIWGATDYSASVAIDEEGFINLTNPARGVHIPRLYIREMKFSDAKKVIEERLSNHVNMSNSQISIELNS